MTLMHKYWLSPSTASKPTLTELTPVIGFNELQLQTMIFSESNIILAVIGLIGVTSSAVVLMYGFSRNRSGSGKYQ